MLFDWFLAPVSTLRSLGFARLGALCLLAGCSAAQPPLAECYRCEVVNSFPHDTNAFTQGLAYCDGELYEGMGLNGRSSIRRVELATGTVLQQHDLPWRYFGEGITLWGDKLIQLTWTARTGFIYDRRSFRLLSSFSYPTDGWGLTHDDTRLVMSDGSATLYFREPDTFAETGRIRVTDGGAPVSNLNALEFIRGEIWASVWQQYRIARISPASGQVLSWIDISGLLSPLDRLLAGSPNGIAYDDKTDRIFVTGKRWPKVFEIRVRRDACDIPVVRPAEEPSRVALETSCLADDPTSPVITD
ncbi:glutaminyl-peptide cyclotransferase [uncultured Thiodictyon sp.]|uniref:glutaminyl-peptide cyclotransferase n=1 Tax=uncultured Thiodictyon sp. TaxID=1846217 RepID=UPI0025F239F5|nr:glutaminyl-peptide cyclotransferase [uncultured Thiodictyon sp.]